MIRFMYGYNTRTNKVKKFFVLIILMAFVSVSSIYIYKMYEKIDVKEYDIQRTSNVEKIFIENEENEKTEKTIEEAANCIVGISKVKNTGVSIFNIDSVEDLGLGSGFIISDNGYIITNWHLVRDKYSSCYVTLVNGETSSGTVVWADKDLDLAIVKINAKGLDYLTLGNTDNLKLGENVYAIGNPIGVEFQRTVTAGIISGLNRTIKIEDEFGESYMEGLIQTDATINQGNSGGALINKSGEVIGVNTIKVTTAEGIGFAVPINIIKPVIDSFINNGKFEEAYLGIFAYDKEAVRYVNSDLQLETGIYVASITKDGGASKTDLKVGDIITKIDEKNINKMSELREYIYTKKPGDEIKLTILRNKKEKEITVNLGKK